MRSTSNTNIAWRNVGNRGIKLSNSQLQNSEVTVNPGTGIAGGGTVVLGGSITISTSNVPNASLQNANITVTAGTGLSGGGTVALGGNVTLANAGVLSATAGTGISITPASTGNITISNTGVTSLSGTTSEIIVSGGTGAVTISLPTTLVVPGSLTIVGGLIVGVATGIIAAGTTQGTATLLTSTTNIIGTVVAGAGVILAGAVAGAIIAIVNLGAAAVKIYPAVGAVIGTLGTNIPLVLAVGAAVILEAVSSTQWYMISAPVVAGSGISISYDSGGDAVITNTGATSISGTANEISASASSGSITLSLPNSVIAPGSLAVTGSFSPSLTTGITAAGSTQGTATLLTTTQNIVTTVASSTGVLLPLANNGLLVSVTNKGANVLTIYPNTGAAIGGQSVNVGISLQVGATIIFQATSSTQWYTLSPPIIAGSNVTVSYGDSGTTISATGGAVSITGGTGITVSPSPITGTGTVSLTTPVTVGNGGTGSSTALGNGHLMYSNSGTIIEAPHAFYDSSSSMTTFGFSQSNVIQPNLVICGSGGTYAGSAIFNTSVLYPGIQDWVSSPTSSAGRYYGGYYDGANLRYSGTNIPIRWFYSSNTFSLLQAAAAGGSAGTTYSSENNIFSVDGSGNIILGFGQGTLSGQPRLSYIGPVQSSAGKAAFSIYNSGDTYPHYSILPYGTSGVDGADNSWQVWDAFYSSGSWVSSTNNSAFAWNKLTNTLVFYCASGLTKNSAISSWTQAFSIDGTTGNVNMNSSITVGGTALQAEQNTSTSLTSTGCVAHSFGAWFYRNGHQVVCKLVDSTGGSSTTSADYVYLTLMIPSGYRPAANTTLPIYCGTGASYTSTTLCSAEITSGGNITIALPTLSGGNNMVDTTFPNASGFNGRTNYLMWHTG